MRVRAGLWALTDGEGQARTEGREPRPDLGPGAWGLGRWGGELGQGCVCVCGRQRPYGR